MSARNRMPRGWPSWHPQVFNKGELALLAYRMVPSLATRSTGLVFSLGNLANLSTSASARTRSVMSATETRTWAWLRIPGS